MQDEIGELKKQVVKQEFDLGMFKKNIAEKLEATNKALERPKINVNALVRPKKDINMINPMELN